jgi:hypothetical protein
MPHHWIRISTGTPPRLRDHVRNPPEFDRELRKIVTECGGEPVHVFFDADCRTAYVLVDGNYTGFDLGRLDGELADAKTCRADLLTADEQAESWESPEQQYDPGSPSEAT